MTFDEKIKMTIKKHLRSVSSAAAQRIGIVRKFRQAFHDRSVLLRFFWSFVQPVLECCSAVWCSAVDSHLILLDRVVRTAVFLDGGVVYTGRFSCLMSPVTISRVKKLPNVSDLTARPTCWILEA